MSDPLHELVTAAVVELMRARVKFPTWPMDPMHAVNILHEEVGELSKAINEHVYNPSKDSYDHIRVESIQTIAMALRFAHSIPDYSFDPSCQRADGARSDMEHGKDQP